MKILLFTLLLLATNLFANIGKVTAVNGDVTITRDTKNLPVSLGFLIEEKDQIKTASNARIQLQFNDKTIISLGKDSVFNVEEYFFDEKQPKKTKASFKMAKGIFKSITGRIGKINPNKFKLKTKSASIGIRGTVFLGTVTPGAPDSIACTTGKIVVSTPEGFVEVPAGQFTTVVPGQAPQKPTKLPKSKANSLENGSGASANEQESGQNEDTVEKQKATPLTPQNGEGGTTPPVDDPEQPKVDPIVSPEKPEVDPNTFTDPKNDPVNNNPVNKVDTYKTGSYKVFQSATYSPKNDALDTNSFSQLASPTIFNITKGVLSGTSTLTYYGVDGYPTVDGATQNYVTSNYTLPYLKISNPSNSYTEYGMIYNHTSNGIKETIYTDNKQEFFVGTKRYTENIEIDLGVFKEYEYIKNTVFGEISTFDSLPSDGISHYADIDTQSGSTILGTSGSYINWKNKSLLSYELQDDGKFFLALGKVTSDENENAKINLNVIEKNPTTNENFSSTGNQNEFYIFGSENQGWGGTATSTDTVSNNSVIKTHGEFKNLDIITKNVDVEASFQGFASTNNSIDNSLVLNIDSNLGISGSINASEISFTGNYTDTTAAYINNDLFATTGFNGTYDGVSISNGWLIAIDSGSLYDDKSDDGISWGFWDVDVSGVNEAGEKAWVAAQDVVSSIASLNFSSAKYQGQAMGFLTDSGVTTYIDPTKSTMELSFDFGQDTIIAKLNVNKELEILKSFSGNSLSTNETSTYSSISGENKIAGSFANSGQTTFGTFNFVNGSQVAAGAYKGKLTDSTLVGP